MNQRAWSCEDQLPVCPPGIRYREQPPDILLMQVRQNIHDPGSAEKSTGALVFHPSSPIHSGADKGPSLRPFCWTGPPPGSRQVQSLAVVLPGTLCCGANPGRGALEGPRPIQMVPASVERKAPPDWEWGENTIPRCFTPVTVERLERRVD
ncbi:hypothetical protein DPEC_G00368620 [Dallia pectoralis]|nr:hypothetical protein DPEC_G00368620 [Dallia pectoralis]